MAGLRKHLGTGVALFAALLFWQAPAEAARRARKPRVKRSHGLKLAVTPSADIEARVEREVEKARDILDRFQPDQIFDSPYLVSALYYHEGFLDDYPDSRPEGNPARRIIARISRLLTPERRARYIEMLREAARREAAEGRNVVPVRYAEMRRRRRTHKFAVDLFAAEGSPVVSATSGVVVLAEGNWERGDPFSTSSQEGGNSVIVFDAQNDRFLRYCHLATTLVRPGESVAAGGRIGTVGHTGFNASRRGHGRHLHFEVNQWDGQHMRPLTNAQLQALVRRWRAAGA